MKKRFWASVLPSMLAFAFSGVYSIVDGFFIGRTIGDLGLAAINFAYPLTVFIQATGIGIGMGGAVGISLCLGRGDAAQEKGMLGNALALLGLACAGVTALLLLAGPWLLRAFGARGDTLAYASGYMRYIAAGASFQLLATGLTPILRNYGRATLAMWAMVAGFAANIALDWLFVPVLGYGMEGAAAATVIGQAITVLPCAVFIAGKMKMLRRTHYRPRRSLVARIAKTGVSPFGLSMCPYVVLMLMNRQAAAFGGNTAVAAYAVISYVTSTVQLLMQGVGDGSQPLMSLYEGLGEADSTRRIRSMAYSLALLVATGCAAFVLLLRRQIPMAFGASVAVVDMTATVMPVFILGFWIVAFLRVTTSYFYATKKDMHAYLLIYGEILLMFVLLAFVLPPRLGLWGVWLSVPCAQGLLLCAGLWLIGRERMVAMLR